MFLVNYMDVLNYYQYKGCVLISMKLWFLVSRRSCYFSSALTYEYEYEYPLNSRDHFLARRLRNHTVRAREETLNTASISTRLW